MKKQTYISFSILAVCMALVIFTLTRFPDDVSAENSVFTEATINYLRQAQSDIFNENWEAFNEFSEVARKHSRVSIGFLTLMRAVQLQAEMFSREERFAEQWMYSCLDSADVFFRTQIPTASGADSARVMYCLAVSQSHRALWDAKFGSFFGAIKKGYSARDYYEQGIVCDSSFAENKIGLGAFLYWKSAKAGGVLRGIGVVSDERELGLQMLREGIAGAHINADVGNSSLVWILLNEKRYKEAGKLASELAERYADGATFLWPLAKAYDYANKYRQTLDTYLLLRKKLLRDPGNQLNLIRVDYEITVLARILEDKETLAHIEKSFDEYSAHTPKKTKRELDFEFRALRRL
ncbi:hypothetical protein JYT16_02220 [Gemmatimonas aurantiaca]|nr:hypothetical protein [Gemmatimonas aurantiaca]